jgi:hypothetical protein
MKLGQILAVKGWNLGKKGEGSGSDAESELVGVRRGRGRVTKDRTAKAYSEYLLGPSEIYMNCLDQGK